MYLKKKRCYNTWVTNSNDICPLFFEDFMKLLLILALCTLATLKVSLQSHFGKKELKTSSDPTFYNGLVFFSSALLFAKHIPGASPQTWLYASLFAIFTVLFQLSYTHALSGGNVSLTVMMVNLSMLLPVLVSVFFFHEPFGPKHAIGIVLTVLSFVLCVNFKDGGKVTKKWFSLTLIATVANAFITISQKIFASSEFHTEKEAFVSCAYLIAFVITLVIYAITLLRKRASDIYKRPRVYLIAISVGLVLALFQWLNTYAMSIIHGTFFFPVFSGGAIIFSTVAGILFFKDKLTVKQAISIVVGVIAVIIMNL